MSGAERRAAATARHLEAALSEIAAAMRGHDGPWWIIGSSALAIHGIGGIDPDDIDVLLPAAGASFLDTMEDATRPALARHPKFRSVLLIRRSIAGWRTEFMAGLSAMTADGWYDVLPESGVAVKLPAGTVYVPDLAELARMLELFDRPKDHERLALLRAQGAAGVISFGPAA